MLIGLVSHTVPNTKDTAIKKTTLILDLLGDKYTNKQEKEVIIVNADK